MSVPCGTGKYTSIQKYDISVFAVNSVLANQMDILNRMVMEPSFEAILDAGNSSCIIICFNAANEKWSLLLL